MRSALQQRERRGRIEVILQHEARPRGERGEREVAGAEGREEGHRDQHALARTQVHRAAGLDGVAREVAVGELHALGERGSPRGVDHVAHVVGRERGPLRPGQRRARRASRRSRRDRPPIRARGARADPLDRRPEVEAQEAVRREQSAALALAEAVGELVRLVARVDGHRDRAQDPERVPGEDPLRPVRQPEAHAIAGRDPAGPQAGREAARPVEQILEAVPPIAVRERLRVAVPGRGPREQPAGGRLEIVHQ